jgi:hypothetical protein
MARNLQTVQFEDFTFNEQPARKKRHPLRNTIISLVIVAAIGIAGYLVAEPLARQTAEEFVKVGVARELGISDADTVHVDLGSGSVLVQVIEGRIKHLHVTVDHFSSGTLAGSAVFTATGVPLNTNKPLSTIGITVSVAAADLRGIVASTADASNATVAFAGKNLRIGTSVTLLGQTLPVSVDLAPKASDGQLLLTPTEITVNSTSYTADQLRASPIGGLVSGLLATRTECVASGLPRNMELTSVVVKNKRLLVSVAGTGVTLASVGNKGSCPAG